VPRHVLPSTRPVQQSAGMRPSPATTALNRQLQLQLTKNEKKRGASPLEWLEGGGYRLRERIRASALGKRRRALVVGPLPLLAFFFFGGLCGLGERRARARARAGVTTRVTASW
jgi:hypothetical protein